MAEYAAADQIEAKLERDRALLAHTLAALQNRLSIDALSRDALGIIGKNAASKSKVVKNAVTTNPLALALTGIGLAWLMFGAKQPVPQREPKPETLSRWEDEGGPVAAAAPMDPDWVRESAAAGGIGQAVSDGVGQLRDVAAERVAIFAEFTDSLKDNIGHGLEVVSTAAQDYGMTARKVAHRAALAAERTSKSSVIRVKQMVQNQPMAVGAAAIVLGAAVAYALPRTPEKDRSSAPERDRLKAGAALALAEETARARLIQDDLGSETSTLADDAAGTGRTAAQKTASAALDRANDGRVAERSDPEIPSQIAKVASQKSRKRG